VLRQILEKDLEFVLDHVLRVIVILLVLRMCVNKDRTIVIFLVGAIAVIVRAGWVRVIAASEALVRLLRFFAATLLLQRLLLAAVTAVCDEPKRLKSMRA